MPRTWSNSAPEGLPCCIQLFSPWVPVRQRTSYETLKKSVMSPVRSTPPGCSRSLWHSTQCRSNTPWTTSG